MIPIFTLLGTNILKFRPRIRFIALLAPNDAAIAAICKPRTTGKNTLALVITDSRTGLN